jgi:hypothetical protein
LKKHRPRQTTTLFISKKASMTQIFKNLFFLGCLAAFSSSVQAQALKSVGVKSGMALSNQSWHYQSLGLHLQYDNQLSLPASLQAEWGLGGKFSLLTEIGYLQKGYQRQMAVFTINEPEGTGEIRVNTRLNYLYFSPQLQFKQAFNAFAAYAFAGPRFEYLASANSHADLTPFESDLEGLKYGLNYGLGLQYNFARFGISTDFTHFYDLQPLIDIETGNGNGGLEVRNQVVALRFGLHYRF